MDLSGRHGVPDEAGAPGVPRPSTWAARDGHEGRARSRAAKTCCRCEPLGPRPTRRHCVSRHVVHFHQQHGPISVVIVIDAVAVRVPAIGEAVERIGPSRRPPNLTSSGARWRAAATSSLTPSSRGAVLESVTRLRLPEESRALRRIRSKAPSASTRPPSLRPGWSATSNGIEPSPQERRRWASPAPVTGGPEGQARCGRGQANRERLAMSAARRRRPLALRLGHVERTRGFEPRLLPWKGSVLQLHHVRRAGLCRAGHLFSMNHLQDCPGARVRLPAPAAPRVQRARQFEALALTCADPTTARSRRPSHDSASQAPAQQGDRLPPLG